MVRSKINVLIADDNKEFACILSDFLNNEDGFEIAGLAKDGIETVNLIKDKNPDVVILDLAMPRLDGIGVLEVLNSLNLAYRPKVIILSAIGNDTFTQKALGLGADYYTVKPFDMAMFAQRLKQLFPEETSCDIDDNYMTNDKKVNKSIDIETVISQFLHELGIQ